MKMKKKLAITITLALCAALCGCREQPSGQTPGNNQSTEVSDTRSDTESTESAGESDSSEENSELSSGTEKTDLDSVPAPPEGYKTLECTFPASEVGKTEHSAHIFNINPFTVSANVPEEWTIKVVSEEEVEGSGNFHGLGFSPVLLMSGDTVIGRMEYMTFKLDNGGYESGELAYRAVYNQIMLGSVYNWDGDYTPIKQEVGFCSATTRIMEAGLEESEYRHAILAYSVPRCVYITIEFCDVNIGDDVLKNIVESIAFK